MIDQNLTMLFCVNISSILTRSPTALAKKHAQTMTETLVYLSLFYLFAFLKNCCLIICESAEGPRASVRAFLRIWQYIFIYIWLFFLFVCLLNRHFFFCRPLFQFALIKKNFEKRTFSDSILIMEKMGKISLKYTLIKLLFSSYIPLF